MTDTTASPGEFTPAQQPAPPARIQSLDTVRGFAVMGILAMNIVAFAMPTAAYMNPMAYGTESPADLYSWVFSFVFIDGRMRGLFSFLFGASMLLVIEGARASGRSAAATHYSRMFWLLVFGLIHFYVIWWGDILALYAPVGMVAFLFNRCRAKTLIIWGIALILVQFLYWLLGAIGFAMISAAAAAPDASPEVIQQWAAMQEGLGRYTPDQLAEQLALYRGSLAGIVAFNLDDHLWHPVTGLLQFGMETLAYFLFGMAAYRSGFLTGAWSDRAYGRTMVVGFGIGLPLLALFAWMQIAADFAVPSLFFYGLALTTLVRPFVIPALAGLVIVLTRSNGPVTQRISAAGRAAFTNYLGTSLIMTFVFYGWGLGYFGMLSRIQLWIPVVLMCAVMLLWSKPWLDHFRYGPLEWLWRSLSRLQVQSMRKLPA